MAWPKEPDPWLEDWAAWRFAGQKPPRPANVPKTKLPEYAWQFLQWAEWRRKGGTNWGWKRPENVPVAIQLWAWDVLKKVNQRVPPKPPRRPDYEPSKPYPRPDPLWELDSCGVVRLSNFATRNQMRSGGYGRIEVLLVEGNKPVTANIEELELIGDELRNRGWRIVGWHSTTKNNPPAEEAKVAMDVGLYLGVEGWNLNGESWYEYDEAWRTEAYWTVWQDDSAGKALPKAVWPLGSNAPAFPRHFDYETCLELGCMVYPQQYANTEPSYTLENGDLNLASSKVPETHRGTSPGVYVGGGAPSIPWDDYTTSAKRMATAGNQRPLLLYGCDMSGFDPVKAIALRDAMRS